MQPTPRQGGKKHPPLPGTLYIVAEVGIPGE